MTVSRFFVVACRPTDYRVVERALYSPSRILASEVEVPYGPYAGKTVLIIETTAPTAEEANRLVAHQADRLRSFGSIGVSLLTHYTYRSAEIEADEMGAIVAYVARLSPAQHLAREFGNDVSEWEV